MPERVIGIALGDLPASEAEAAARTQLGSVPRDWLDRGALRRRPLQTLTRLWKDRYAAAVLVAPDLRQSRLKLTSLVLCLPRAQRRWRIDLLGHREAFSLGDHLSRQAWPIARHLAAMALAFLMSRLLLTLLDWFISRGPRRVHTRFTNHTGRTATQPQLPSRILYLRSQLWLGLEGGGSVAHTAGVIGGLEQTGVEVHVVSSDRLPGVTAPTDVIQPETWFDGWLRELEDLAYNVGFFVGALHAARTSKPQAIYQRHTAFNCSGALLARLLGLPLVLEFNSSELWKGRYWGGLQRTREAALVERINLLSARRTVVVSRVLRDQLIAIGVPDETILVNPNAVDTTTFHPAIDGTAVRQKWGLGGPSTLVVGFSGTFGLWHGIPTLAAVLPRVIAARPDVRWLLIGDGPLRKLIDDSIEQHGLEGVVQPGLVPHAEMPAYLAACDILVSPHGRQADGQEFFGSPTKLFEYMAAGRPIVASAVGQIADVLRDEESALLVPPDDADALCRAILRLVDDQCLRQRLAAAARAAAEEHHTWRQNAERVLASLAQEQPAWSR